MPDQACSGTRHMSAQDADIAALAKRLGLRGLRYRSFAPAPMPPAARETPAAPPAEAAAVPVLPAGEPPLPAFALFGATAAAMPQAVPMPPAPLAPEPPVLQDMPFAAPMPAPQPAAFPLLGSALAAAAQRPAAIPASLPEAARPFAALRLAVAGDEGRGG